MEFKLRVNEGKENAKTYTTDTIDFTFGVVEDVMEVLDFDKMDDKMAIGVMIMKSATVLKPFLKDLFEGVTDEEIRTVKMSNLVEIFKGLYKYAVDELGMLSKLGN